LPVIWFQVSESKIQACSPNFFLSSPFHENTTDSNLSKFSFVGFWGRAWQQFYHLVKLRCSMASSIDFTKPTPLKLISTWEDCENSKGEISSTLVWDTRAICIWPVWLVWFLLLDPVVWVWKGNWRRRWKWRCITGACRSKTGIKYFMGLQVKKKREVH